ncbi:DNA polymerase III subunit gamma/tau [Psychrobacter sp. HD31]|uniref:DNA polymerase III subunit gamma/tau n=1 Tax=Psychrobacter sp. HD31 TaxID=3112003 RepID=UPI003DA3BE7E
MSQPYQVLARKYRPNNFHELIGQSHVSQALINAIDHNRLHHAYLFTGTRGVGKTTIARILSKCLNCDTGVTSTPCGTCDSCVAIEQGRFIDLIEIDAASRTKVEDTRELLDNVPYAPTQGRYKVYLIDEVHMLSTHSFNALLKTLEEPPEHVKFLLATTDPQKLPITIVSRCLQFVLRPLPQQLLTEHLAKLLTNENIEFEDAALWQLAHAAKGSVRDSLSLTDQAVAFGQGKLTQNTVNEMLGLIDGADLAQLLIDIFNNDKKSVAAHIEQMRQQMVDAGSVFDELTDLLHKIALFQIMPTIELNVNRTQTQAINQLAKVIPADVLQLYYEIAIKSREGIMLATTPMQALEMCILRMLAFRPLTANQSFLSEDDVAVIQDTNQPQIVDNTAIHDTNNPIEEDSLSPHPEDDTDTLETEVIKPKHVETDAILDAEDTNSYINETEASLALSTDSSEAVKVLNQEPETLEGIDETANQDDYVLQPNEAEVSDLSAQPSSYASQFSSNITTNTPDIEQEQQAVAETKTKEFQTRKNTIESNDADLTVAEENQTNPYDDEQNDNHNSVDPRMLLDVKEQNLTGDWTAEKWDFWLHKAREEAVLDAEEIAFARQGVMEGSCDGESTFMTTADVHQFKPLFNKICKKLTQQFSNASYQMQAADANNLQKVAKASPYELAKKRKLAAENAAKVMLMQSTVMQKLEQIDDVDIEAIKLRID